MEDKYLLHKDCIDNFVIWINKNEIYKNFCKNLLTRDKFDKKAMPKVMQVKKFGFAGYSTKYQGLAKEDTTDKKMDFLPVKMTTKKFSSRSTLMNI